TGRRPWFRCSCCPPNVARFLASFGSYVYAKGDDGIYVNLFVGGRTRVDLGGRRVELSQATEYPWKGDVAIRVKPDAEAEFALRAGRGSSRCRATCTATRTAPVFPTRSRSTGSRRRSSWSAATPS